ncbi:MAG: hypothetical protein KDD40_01850, partial [Bdellovibrionales bacterium]|nr:hypothetical protein [Bdellovibrionales bacterium]
MKFLKFLIILSLTFNNIPVTHAKDINVSNTENPGESTGKDSNQKNDGVDKINKEKSYVDKTHDYSKLQAENILSGALVQALYKTLNYNMAGAFDQHIEELAQDSEFIQSKLQMIQSYMQLNQNEVLDLTEETLAAMHQDLRTLAREVRHIDSSLHTRMLNVQELQNIFPKVARDITHTIHELCEKGVAVDPYSEMLPVIKPIMPSYSIYIQAPIAGEPTPESYAGSGGQVGSGDEAAVIWTLTYAINFVVALKLVTGKLILTQTAMSTVSTAQAATSAAYAAAATLVIAVIVILVSLYGAQQASVRAVKSARFNFLNRADAEDGRTYLKEKCNLSKVHFDDLLPKMELIAMSDKATLDQLTQESPIYFTQMETLLSAHAAY